MIDYFFFFFGVATLSKIFIYAIECIWCLCLPMKRFKGWVCITGGSDGIGLGIAKDLAKNGVNLVLVSRSKEKLENAKSILSSYQCEVALVQANLASCDLNYLKSVMEKIKRFEITGLINCAGISYGCFFHMHKQADLINMLNLHTWPIVLFSKEFENAWIVNVSSTAGVTPSPILTVYSATKAFIHNFTEVLSTERKNVLSYRCGFVDTEMTRSVKYKPYMIKPSEVSNFLLPCISHKSSTFGHWKHWFMGTALTVLPNHFTTMNLLHIVKKRQKIV